MYYCGSFRASVAGQKIITGLPFTPNKLRFVVNKTDSKKYLSAGEASTSGQQANTTYFDIIPTGEVLSDPTKCLTHYDRQATELIKVLSLSFISFRTNGFKINIDIPNPSIQIYVEAWG